METLQNIQQLALQIRDASEHGENTARRVGTLLAEIANYISSFPTAASIRVLTQENRLQLMIGTTTIDFPIATNTQAGVVSPQQASLWNGYAAAIATERTERTTTDANLLTLLQSEATARGELSVSIRGEIATLRKAIEDNVGYIEVENYGKVQVQLNNHRARIDSVGGIANQEISDRKTADAAIMRKVEEVEQKVTHLPLATATTQGLMSGADKARLSNTHTAQELNHITATNSGAKWSSYPALVQHLSHLPLVPMGDMSLAVGQRTKAHGLYNIAMGLESVAGDEHRPSAAKCAVACGYGVRVSAGCAAGFGKNNHASGFGSLVAGENNIASGLWAVAMGKNTKAGANNAFAMGWMNVVTGAQAVAMGSKNSVSGENATAFGEGNVVAQRNAFYVGRYSKGVPALFAVGTGDTVSNRKTAFYVGEDSEVYFWHHRLNRFVKLSELKLNV